MSVMGFPYSCKIKKKLLKQNLQDYLMVSTLVHKMMWDSYPHWPLVNSFTPPCQTSQVFQRYICVEKGKFLMLLE